jgi:hypothetical protein
MTINIDGQRAVDLLRKVVPLKGEDYVYDTHSTGGDCVYLTYDLKPSCVVGYALLEAGVSRDVLYRIDHDGVDYHDPETGEEYHVGDTGIDSHELGYYLEENEVHLTEDAQAILGAAQRAQDNGETWGRALWRAEHIAL